MFRNTILLRATLGALLIGCAGAAGAGPGFWDSRGPYGGSTYRLLIDPVVPTTMYAASRGGVYKTTDGGSTWASAQNGLVASVSWTSLLGMDTDAAANLYIFDASGALQHTSDGAANWAATGFSLANFEGAIAFADVPGNTGTFYLGTSPGEAGVGGLRKSTNSGVTAPFVAGLPSDQGFAAVAVDPADANRVLAGTDYHFSLASTDPSRPSIYRSTDGGGTWTPVLTPGGTGSSQRVGAIAFGAGAHVYAIVDGSLMHSGNDGATWALVPNQSGFGIIAVLPHPTLSGVVYLGGNEGVQTASNADTAGATFGALSTTLAPTPTYTDGLGRVAQARVLQLVAEPAFPAGGAALWAVTEAAGLYRSFDAAATWSASDVNHGLAAVNVRALAVQPGAAPRRIFAGFGDAPTPSLSLFRSLDNGTTWPAQNNGLRGVQIRAITLDPTTTASPGTTTVWATGRAASTGVPQPNVSPGVAIRNAGIYRSTTGGNTWSVLDGGIPRTGTAPNDFAFLGTVRSVWLDPRSCGASPVTGALCTTGPLQKAIITSTGRSFTVPDGGGGPAIPRVEYRIARTTNGNAAAASVMWANRENGLPQPLYTLFDPDGGGPAPGFNSVSQSVVPVPIVASPDNSDVLYVGMFANFDRTEVTSPTIASGVFKTIDGGANWTQVSNGLPRYAGAGSTHLDVLALAIHPTDANVLWATVVNTVTYNPPVVPRTSGIYKTVDGGANWTSSSTGIPSGLDIRALIVDPADPAVLYAAGGGTGSNPGAVYRSEDSGSTWSSISVGLPADSALSLALDPVNATILHAGTNIGVWSLEQVPDDDGDGAPNANENFAPNGGDGNADGQQDASQAQVGSSVVMFSRDQVRAGLVGRGTLASGEDGPNGTAGGYFTTDIQTAGCPRAVDVQGLLAAPFGRDPIVGTTPPRFYAYPRDLVRFEIPNCGHAVVDITFHNVGAGGLPPFTDSSWSFRVYAPQIPGDDSTLGWYDLGSRAQKISGTKWRITLDANQFGSYRPVTDNILFVGGPAQTNDRLFANGFE
jgi:photosystem II stability/assembly factor-like uncharacterized protein